jgi:hypothetical protein
MMISSRQVYRFVLPALLLFGSRVLASANELEKGTLVEATEFDPCHHDCAPFVTSSLFYCVQVRDRVLIGTRKADSSSYMLQFQGKPVSVRYDSRSLWIVRPDGTEVHLSRDHLLLDPFRSSVCTAGIHREWLARLGTVARPAGVPAQAMLIPQSHHSYFWVSCVFVPSSNWDACSVWDSEGSKYAVREVVSQPDRRAVLDSELVIDPLTTTNDYEFHLENGRILRDWAKGRINNVPSPDSLPPLPPLTASQLSH